MDDYPHAHHCRHGLAGDTGDFRLQGHRFSGHHRKSHRLSVEVVL